ncbi:MAG: hypothetical protein GY842_01240, partial [bacterium]|nr:hypothetical protein [bacterium]
SFFDITYQIEFEGCPGSVLDGYMGTTTATIRMQTGRFAEPPSCIGGCPPDYDCVEDVVQKPDGSMDLCCYCRQPGDCTGDDIIDLDDYAVFHACIDSGGPGGGLSSGCECVDMDNDIDVDLADFRIFQAVFTGS